MKVQFLGVGNGKASWVTDFDEFLPSNIIRSVREHRALASKYLDVEFEPDGSATIFAGFRAVGCVIREPYFEIPLPQLTQPSSLVGRTE